MMNQGSTCVLLLLLLGHNLGVLGEDHCKLFNDQGCSCTEERINCPATEERVSIQIDSSSRATVKCYKRTEPTDLVKYLFNSTILISKTELNLENCVVDRLSDLGLEIITPLQEITFINNFDELKLDSNTFKWLFGLKYFNIQANRLQEVSGDAFGGLSELIHLSIDDTRLSSLPVNLFNDQTQLNSLSLTNNALTSLPDAIFHPLVNLTTIGLYMNSLETLPENLFINNKDIKGIYLGYNRLSSLPANLFQDLKKLQTLDIGHNFLTSLPDAIFTPLVNLKEISLNNNHLKTLPENLFFHNKNATHINLYRNMLSRVQIHQFPHTLKDLDLSRNRIELFQKIDVDYLELMTNKTNLLVSLGGNPYSCGCEMTDLYHFTQRKNSNLQDIRQMLMNCPENKKKPFSGANIRDFCPPLIDTISTLVQLCIEAIINLL